MDEPRARRSDRRHPRRPSRRTHRCSLGPESPVRMSHLVRRGRLELGYRSVPFDLRNERPRSAHVILSSPETALEIFNRLGRRRRSSRRGPRQGRGRECLRTLEAEHRQHGAPSGRAAIRVHASGLGPRCGFAPPDTRGESPAQSSAGCARTLSGDAREALTRPACRRSRRRAESGPFTASGQVTSSGRRLRSAGRARRPQSALRCGPHAKTLVGRRARKRAARPPSWRVVGEVHRRDGFGRGFARTPSRGSRRL